MTLKKLSEVVGMLNPEEVEEAAQDELVVEVVAVEVAVVEVVAVEVAVVEVVAVEVMMAQVQKKMQEKWKGIVQAEDANREIEVAQRENAVSK